MERKTLLGGTRPFKAALASVVEWAISTSKRSAPPKGNKGLLSEVFLKFQDFLLRGEED